jgi:signal transduction histidine kinase
VDSNATELVFRANRFDLVSSIADDLAHEIKNPLNSIIVNLEVLKIRLARADTASAMDRAAVIEEEVRRLHQLVDRVLLLLRPEREETSELALDSALDELLPLLEAQTRLARNEFRYHGSASVMVAVRRDILKFALLNLILAIHARLGEGGGALDLRCAAGENSVTLTIEAVDADRGTPVAAADGDLAGATDKAEALLAGTGARIVATDAGVSLTVPRSVAT